MAVAGEQVRLSHDILDQFLPLSDFQAISYPAQIDAAAVTADFPADAACAQLVGHGGLGIECELYAAALAASIEFPN